MSDEELIARLRWHIEHPVTGNMVLTNPDGPAAADRLEALIGERDRQYDENVHRIAEQAKAEARAERLERIVRVAQQWVGNHTIGGEAWHEEARAALTQKEPTDGE